MFLLAAYCCLSACRITKPYAPPPAPAADLFRDSVGADSITIATLPWNQIFTDSAFTLVEPSRQLSGIGFESDPKLTLFKCLRACKAVAPVEIPAK